MLEAARQRLPGVAFVQADIGAYRLEHPVDIIFANASLHWLPDHLTLLPALRERLKPGGVLAVQMPCNSDEPSHLLMDEIADRPAYAPYRPAVAQRRQRVAAAEAYFDCLADERGEVTVWETRYLHELADAGAIARWFGSTALQPYLDALPDTLRDAFLRDYIQALEAAYPRRVNGSVLLALPRLFIVAQRRH
jgi:trans-aconitate 2-methyltransferase